mmetsp:Transcript_26995/g.44066  ORF Transcript_26995/g.44066 Transcript_26995/m.44066 type:complete len:80 (-) Transcript_26995:285-524(-)
MGRMSMDFLMWLPSSYNSSHGNLASGVMTGLTKDSGHRAHTILYEHEVNRQTTHSRILAVHPLLQNYDTRDWPIHAPSP